MTYKYKRQLTPTPTCSRILIEWMLIWVFFTLCLLTTSLKWRILSTFTEPQKYNWINRISYHACMRWRPNQIPTCQTHPNASCRRRHVKMIMSSSDHIFRWDRFLSNVKTYQIQLNVSLTCRLPVNAFRTRTLPIKTCSKRSSGAGFSKKGFATRLYSIFKSNLKILKIITSQSEYVLKK